MSRYAQDLVQCPRYEHGVDWEAWSTGRWMLNDEFEATALRGAAEDLPLPSFPDPKLQTVSNPAAYSSRP